MTIRDEDVIHQFARKRSLSKVEIKDRLHVRYINWKLKIMIKKGILTSTLERIPNKNGVPSCQRVYRLA